MVTTIFGGLIAVESRRDRKLTARQVLAVNAEDAIANPSYRPWSKVAITFSRAEQWADIPYIGCFPMFFMQPSGKCFLGKYSSMAKAP